MSVPVVAFFNNKGGVGKTSLVYHLAWMMKNFDLTVLAVDLDPQANLTSSFLPEERLEAIWSLSEPGKTLYSALQPSIRGVGDIADAHIEAITDRLGLLVGDLRLSSFEDKLSDAWPGCLSRDERAFRVSSAFWRIMQGAAARNKSDLIFVDIGPNLGAINRSALISSDWVVIPLSPDLYSLQGLRNLGPALEQWRKDWSDRKLKSPAPSLELPAGKIQPAGYVVLQHAVRLDRPVKAYDKWIRKIPSEYHKSILGDELYEGETIESDPENLAMLKHYRSLMPMAQEARKPVFHLKPADGAIGAHAASVSGAYDDFHHLAERILGKICLGISPSSAPGLPV